MARDRKYQKLCDWQEERKAEKRAEEDERIHIHIVREFEDFGPWWEEDRQD